MAGGRGQKPKPGHSRKTRENGRCGVRFARGGAFSLKTAKPLKLYLVKGNYPMLESVAMTPSIDTRKVMTPAEAARRLNISRQAVWLAISKKRLTKVDVGGVTFVTTESVQQYKKTRHPGGPKSKK